MATTTLSMDALVRAAGDRQGLRGLLTALGFEPLLEPVPREAWSGYGLGASTDVAALVLAGRAGSLDALLLETASRIGPETVAAAARAVRARNPVRLHLFLFAESDYRRLVVAGFGLDGGLRHLLLDRHHPKRSDLDALEEMLPADGDEGLALALRQLRALDRSRVTRRFFRDFRSWRAAVAESWVGIPAEAERERSQLALLFLSRLTFLYFLQQRGALAGDDRYLVRLFGAWSEGRNGDGGGGPAAPGTTFFRRRLAPLFFGALNRRPEERSPAARALGPLPYLNGGLFEPHALERRHPELDLPDAEVRGVLEELLERYRFTTREAGDGAGFGVDPEVLGRVFEGLMAPEQRGDTGSFYTPAPVVDRVVREAVATYVAGACPGVDAHRLLASPGPPIPPDARYRVRRTLERIRILDPACGSGAFLLGALRHLAGALGVVSDRPGPAVRREIVARSLHGVDLLEDAALLCSLRLWLALSGDDDEVRPLPNLDRRIRQGNALVDPLDLDALGLGDDDGTGLPRLDPLRDPAVRRALAAVGPASRTYLASSAADRAEARRALERSEERLARLWVDRLRAGERERLRHLGAHAADRDLFGDAPDSARRAARARDRGEERVRELDEVARALEERGSLPFFSFGVHFADAVAGFDVIVSNPPWVRAHRWPARLRRLAARRYRVCRDAGWPAAAALTGAPAGAGAQVDLSLLFVERSLRLLAPGGVLAVVVPAKSLRALYGGAARRILLADLELSLIEDHALDQRSIFRADAFAAVIIGRRPGRPADPHAAGAAAGATAAAGQTRVRMVRRGRADLEFTVRPRELPLFPGDPASPWLLAPPSAVAAFRAMQEAGPPLGRHPGLTVRRGVMTGANDVLIMADVEPRLGGLARVEAEGYRALRRRGRPSRDAARFRAHVETRALRPLVRGADIDAFRYRSGGHVVWCHGPDGSPAEPPPRMARYLRRHRDRLEARPGWRPGLPLGAVFRLNADTLRPKVAWHDLSDTLRAVALPATVPFDGRAQELVPLNTVYFLPLDDADDAAILAGLLNSLPVRTFARAIAERAKDARFRFFAWTIACLPLPPTWRDRSATAPVRTIARVSRAAAAAGGIHPDAQAELDHAVAALYDLTDDHVAALDRFDAWLRGAP